MGKRVELAERFTSVVNRMTDRMMRDVLSLHELKVSTPDQAQVIRVYMEETAREAARIAYRDCAAVAKLSQDQAFAARNETSPTSGQYAALDGAVGAFAGMAFTYLQFEGTFCDGEKYKDQNMPSVIDIYLGQTSSLVEEHKLKDPRKKGSS